MSSRAVQADTKVPAPSVKVSWSIWIACIPAAFLVTIVLLKLINRSIYWRLVIEDGLFETLTAVAYLGAALFAFGVSFVLRRSGPRWAGWLYLLLGVGFLFISGEEISWGQRIFNVASPEFFEQYNHQQELNLHNFAGGYLLHLAYIIVSGVAATAWLFLPKLLPQALRRDSWLLAPAPWLMGFFLPVTLLYIYYDYLNPLIVALLGPQYHFDTGTGRNFFIIARDQESIELLMGMGFLIFVATNWLRLRSAGQLKPDRS